jgi:hypothetical protein
MEQSTNISNNAAATRLLLEMCDPTLETIKYIQLNSQAYSKGICLRVWKCTSTQWWPIGIPSEYNFRRKEALVRTGNVNQPAQEVVSHIWWAPAWLCEVIWRSCWQVRWSYWFLNKLSGFVQGAIRRLDLQREESSESSVWDVDIKSTEFPGSGNIAQMLIY